MDASAPASPMTVEEGINRLHALAAADGATVYSINYGSAGWGVAFISTNLHYDSLQACIDGEIARLEAKAVARLAAADAVMAANVAGPIDDKRADHGSD